MSATTTYQPGDRVAVLNIFTGKVEAHGTIITAVPASASRALIQYDSFAEIGGTHSVQVSCLAPTDIW